MNTLLLEDQDARVGNIIAEGVFVMHGVPGRNKNSERMILLSKRW